MASARQTKRPVSERDIEEFVAQLIQDDGLLSDSDIEGFEDSDNEIDEEAGNWIPEMADDDKDFCDEENNEENEEPVAEAPPIEVRKQTFKNLDDRLDDTNYDDLPPQADEEFVYTSRDKKTIISWKTTQTTVGRAPQRNIIRGTPGASRLARHANDPLKAWELFITGGMIEAVTNFTNKKIDEFLEKFQDLLQSSNKYSHYKQTTNNEIRAFFGILYFRGALKLNLRKTDEIFYHRSSPDIFAATMNAMRFKFLRRFIEFDDFTTRPERWQSDKFAAFREFLEELNKNCAKMRVPSEYLSIDETLYPYRGNVRIRQYNPSKPARYGLLYRSISDARVPYTYYSIGYAGKPEGVPNKYYISSTDGYTRFLVDSLKEYVKLTGRNISMDGYFTSLSIADYLIENDMTLVGTMKSNRVGLPKELIQNADRDDLSVKYAFADGGNKLLVSYVVQKESGKRNVLVLSTMHNSVKVTRDVRRKPNVISFYDCTKGGVDVMDMISGNLSTRIKSRRWPVNALAYALDTARTNAQTILKDNNANNKRSSFEFCWELGEALVKAYLLERHRNPIGLQSGVLSRINKVLGVEPVIQQKPPDAPTDRKRCHVCLGAIRGTADYKQKKQRLAKTKWICESCQLTICKTHSKMVCNACVKQINEEQ